jgi:hypothetical protein
LRGLDLLSPQASPFTLQKKSQQLSDIRKIIVDQRLAYTRFTPDAIHRQGRNTFPSHNLGNMIQDKGLPFAWGETDPFLRLRQSTLCGV